MTRVPAADPHLTRRKRLRFRSHHRGTREMDLLLGRFADAVLPGLGPAELDAFEALIEIPDDDLYAWKTGRETPPHGLDTPLVRRFLAFDVSRTLP